MSENAESNAYTEDQIAEGTAVEQVTEDTLADEVELVIPLSNCKYSSIGAAAADTNLPADLIKLAKQSGCPGFDNAGRIDWSLVGPWLTENLDAIQESDKGLYTKAKATKMYYDSLRSRLAYEIALGKLMPKEDVTQQVRLIATTTQSLLKRILESELPAKIAGLSAIAIKEKMQETTDLICNTFKKPLAEWLDIPEEEVVKPVAPVVEPEKAKEPTPEPTTPAI